MHKNSVQVQKADLQDYEAIHREQIVPVLAGLLAALLVLIALLYGHGKWLNCLFISTQTFRPKDESVANIKLVYVEEPKISRFIEANIMGNTESPAVPTENFSALEQRAAQPIPAKIIDPAQVFPENQTGESEDSQKIVQHENLLASEAVPQVLKPELPQDPIVAKKGPLLQEALVRQPTAPMSRPQLPNREKLFTQAPLRRTKAGVTYVGNMAVSTQFSEQGAYLQQFYERLYYAWRGLVQQAGVTFKDRGTFVLLSFELCATGHVEALKVLERNGSELTAWLCEDALKSQAPYPSWTPSMQAQLGQKQKVTIRFMYE